MIDERRWHHDPWDDPDITDALVIERPRKQPPAVQVVRVALMASSRSPAWSRSAIGGLWYTEQVNPKGDPGDPVTFTVNADDTLETISERLEAEGLITKAWVFRWYVDHHGGLELTPGYYQLRPNDHMGNIMRILRTPPSETFTKVTFPEGYTYAKMGKRLEDKVPRLSQRRLRRGRHRRHDPLEVPAARGSTASKDCCSPTRTRCPTARPRRRWCSAWSI